MKRGYELKTGQYAYTTDGRVIEILEILEEGKKYRGADLKDSGHPKVEVSRADIYGVAFRFRKAV